MPVTLTVGKSQVALTPDMPAERMNDYCELHQLEARLAAEPEETYMVISLSKGAKKVTFAWDATESADSAVLHRTVCLLDRLY